MNSPAPPASAGTGPDLGPVLDASVVPYEGPPDRFADRGFAWP